MVVRVRERKSGRPFGSPSVRNTTQSQYRLDLYPVNYKLLESLHNNSPLNVLRSFQAPYEDAKQFGGEYDGWETQVEKRQG